MSIALNASNSKRVEVTLTNPLVANTMYRDLDLGPCRSRDGST